MADTSKRQQDVGRQQGRPKGSTAKRSSASSAKGKSAGPKGKKKQDTEFMRAEVVIICSFAVAILLFLSNFKLCGVVGEALRGVQLGLFGMVGYVIPLILFVGTCFHLSNRHSLHAAMKLTAAVAAVFTICGLLQLLFGTVPQGAHFSEYFRQSAPNGVGGGWLGGVAASLLVAGVGKAGAFLVLIVLFIICMVCITERSFVSVVKRGGDKAYQYAREDMDRRRELHAQKAEEKRRLREEQKVRGVNLDATMLTAPQEEYDEALFDREFGADLEEMPQGRGGGPAGGNASFEASKANEFRGRFDPPLEDMLAAGQDMADMGDPSAVASSIEGYNRGMNMHGAPAGAEQDIGDGIEGGEEYDTIRARRDSRTLEEMDMTGSAGGNLDAWEEIPWDTGRGSVSGSGSDYPGMDSHTGVSPSGIGNVSYGRLAPDSGQAGMPDSVMHLGDAWEMPEQSDAALETGYAPAPFEISGADSKEIGVYAPHAKEASYADDSYQESAPVPGDAFDRVNVAEEPKRVVTASGKVIETDTELLQKKIEKKREEAERENANTNIGVAQEIKQKEEEVKKEYVFPPTSLLKKSAKAAGAFSGDEYKATAIKLQQTLHNFGVGVTVTNISCGPAVTRYELAPEQGVKVSRIVGLADDIKLSLAAADIRIEAPIPGKSAVGIEVPNKENNLVYLRELLESDAFRNHKSRLAFAVGKDIGGQVVVADIGKMPHLLIAGATGSGKSVCINTLIMSVIFKSRPEDVKLIMVDPKVVELSVYNGIPHLLIPVVTDPKKASGALNWAVAEMTDRYQKFAQCNVRDLKGYNERVEKLGDIEDENKPQKLPQIIIIIDELADLMMVAPGEVEDSVCRLAQLARAAGIHLVIATQRPSVNVITGLIKANVPSRIAFAVSSGVDSRTIIDMNGAEKLLGKGDMLFYPSGFPKPQRVQGAFVSDEEVGNVVDFLTEQGMVAQYSKEVESRVASPGAGGTGASDRDEYFIQAAQFIIEKEKASIGMLQRMFKIGFNRAARIMDQLAEAGVVGEEEGTKPRKVLMSMEEFEEMLEQGG